MKGLLALKEIVWLKRISVTSTLVFMEVFRLELSMVVTLPIVGAVGEENLEMKRGGESDCGALPCSCPALYNPTAEED